METGIPMLVADSPWEGRENGIYRKLDDEYGRTMHLSFLSVDFQNRNLPVIQHDLLIDTGAFITMLNKANESVFCLF